MTRTCAIKIRLTDDEHAQLIKRSRKPRLAAWMREHCLAADVLEINQVARMDPALLRQLAGIGNNLNQLARAVNKGPWDAIDQVSVVTRLAGIEQAIERLKFEASRDR